jgi:hypothetical protein
MRLQAVPSPRLYQEELNVKIKKTNPETRRKASRVLVYFLVYSRFLACQSSLNLAHHFTLGCMDSRQIAEPRQAKIFKFSAGNSRTFLSAALTPTKHFWFVSK